MERVKVRNWENGNFNFNFVQYQVNQGKLVSIYKVEKSEWSLEVKRIEDRTGLSLSAGSQCSPVHCSTIVMRVDSDTYHIRFMLITLTIMIMIDFSFTPSPAIWSTMIMMCNETFPTILSRHKSFVSRRSRITFVCKQSGLNDPVSIKWSPGTISNFYASHRPQYKIGAQRLPASLSRQTRS